MRAARRVSLAPLVRRYLDAARSRARFSLRRSVHRFSIFAEYVLDRRERHPVFVLSQPRTGSSLLMSYLRSIPDADFASEVLNPHKLFGLRVKLTSKRAVIRHLAHSMNHCRGRLCGGTIHLQHLAQRGMSLADADRAFPTARYLVLYRRSLLEQFVSLKLSEATRSWKWRADYHPPPCLRLDPEELHAFCEENQRWYREVLDTPRIVSRALVIAYEDLARTRNGSLIGRSFPFSPSHRHRSSRECTSRMSGPMRKSWRTSKRSDASSPGTSWSTRWPDDRWLAEGAARPASLEPAARRLTGPGLSRGARVGGRPGAPRSAVVRGARVRVAATPGAAGSAS